MHAAPDSGHSRAPLLLAAVRERVECMHVAVHISLHHSLQSTVAQIFVGYTSHTCWAIMQRAWNALHALSGMHSQAAAHLHAFKLVWMVLRCAGMGSGGAGERSDGPMPHTIAARCTSAVGPVLACRAAACWQKESVDPRCGPRPLPPMHVPRSR